MLDDKINKGFPDRGWIRCVVVGFGMYGEFRFKRANKYTVEHSVYVNNDFQGELEK
jgi:phosphinothricin acetyltransferase